MNRFRIKDCSVTVKERTCLERYVKVLHRPTGVFVVEVGVNVKDTINTCYTALELLVRKLELETCD